MSTRQTLTDLCEAVITQRFIHYAYTIVPIALQPTDYAIEVHRDKPIAPATGTIQELHTVLEKYLHSRGFHTIEILEATPDTLKMIVRST